MYAICEANRGYGIGGRSADKHGGEWWTGQIWSPASNEAKIFDSMEEAKSHASVNCSREWAVVELCD